MKTFYCVGSINYDLYEIESTLIPKLGGSATNTAYFLSNLLDPDEYDVSLIGLIGNDDNGHSVTELLEKKKIVTDHVHTWEGKTGSTTITLDEGEREITHIQSVTYNLPEYCLHLDRKTKTRLSQSKIHLKANLKTLETLFTFTNELFSYDISGIVNDKYLQRQDHFRELIIRLFKENSIEILFGNEEEFAYLLFHLNLIEKKEDFTNNLDGRIIIMRKLLPFTSSKMAIVKMGANGSFLFTMTKVIQIDALKVDVVDTTGAGDAFNAGFIFAYLKKLSLYDSLHIASALGSVNSTVLGGQTLEIMGDELKQLVKDRYTIY